MNIRLLVNRLLPYGSVFLLCALPLLLTFGVVHLYFKADLSSYSPKGGDYLVYWHEAGTFQKVGFQGGHYGFEELAAPAAHLGWGTFGAHSLWLPMLYGSIARLTGWEPSTGIAINLAIFCLAWAVTAWLMKGGARFHLFCLLFILSTPYILLQLPVFSMEPLYFSLAAVLSGLFYRLIVAGEQRGRALKIGLFIFLFTSALLRYSFGLLFLPFFLIVDNPRTWLGVLLSLGKGLLSVLAPMSLYLFFAAPYPYDPFPGSKFGLKVYVDLFHGDYHPLVNLISTNITGLFAPETLSAYHFLCWEIIASAIMFPALVLLTRRNGTLKEQQVRDLFRFHALSLGLTIVSCILYYYFTLGMVGLRVSMPIFLCCVLLFARSMDQSWLFPFMVLNLVLAPAIFSDTQRNYQNEYDPYRAVMGRRDVGAVFSRIAYQPEAPSPWCNTVLLFGIFDVDSMLFLPTGVSVNSMRMPEQVGRVATLRSRFVVTNNAAANDMLEKDQDFKKIDGNAHWSLYLNNKCQCGSSASRGG